MNSHATYPLGRCLRARLRATALKPSSHLISDACVRIPRWYPRCANAVDLRGGIGEATTPQVSVVKFPRRRLPLRRYSRPLVQRECSGVCTHGHRETVCWQHPVSQTLLRNYEQTRTKLRVSITKPSVQKWNIASCRWQNSPQLSVRSHNEQNQSKDNKYVNTICGSSQILNKANLRYGR